jgi:hypothetical protein
MPREQKSESAIEGFAEDLGSLLGTAQGKAESWLAQRKEIVKNLTQLRDTASRLLVDMGHQAERVVRRGRKPAEEIEYAPAPKSKRQRRKLSAKARAAIATAQKARWAKFRADKEKVEKKK